MGLFKQNKLDFWMVTFPILPLTGFTFLNLFGLLECQVMWLISMPVIKVLTAKLLQQGYRYHKLRKTFSKFYRRHYELVSKFNVGLKTLLHQGLSEPEFYDDLVYKFKKKIYIGLIFLISSEKLSYVTNVLDIT